MDNSKNLSLRNLDFLSTDAGTIDKTKSQKSNTTTPRELKSDLHRDSENLLKIEYYKEQLTSLSQNLHGEMKKSQTTHANLQQAQSELISTKKELESLKALMNSEKKTTAQLNAQLSHLTLALDASRNEVTKTNHDLISEKETLITKIKILEQSKNTVNMQLSARTTELSELKARLSIYRAEEEKLKSATTDLKIENQKLTQQILHVEKSTTDNSKLFQQSIESLKQELQTKNESLKHKELYIQNLQSDLLNMKNDIHISHLENSKLSQSLQHLQQSSTMQNQKFTETNALLKADLAAAQTQVQSLQSDLAHAKTETHTSQTETHKLKQTIDYLKDKSALQIQQSHETNTQLKQDLNKKSEELALAQTQIRTIQSDFKNLNDQLHTADLEIQKQTMIIKDLSEKLNRTAILFSEQEKMTSAQILENKTLTESVKSLSEQNLSLKKLEQDYLLKINESNEKNYTLNCETKANKALIQKLQNEVQQKTKVGQEYLGFLNSEKNRIEKTFEQLTKEIHHAMALHPLKDVLKMTELELSSCELELKKMPVAAPNRKLTEHKFDKLFQQRNQLRELIAHSDKSLMGFTKKVDNLQKSLDVFDMPVPA